MTQKERYQAAKEMYAAIGVDTDAAIAKLKTIPVSLHCWQGDDVTGFDHDGPLTGGIQTTGNYPGKARTPEELMADIDMVIKCTPGLKKLNLHASYAILKMVSLLTEIRSSLSTLLSGWLLQKKEIWELTLTLHSSHILM